MHRHAFLIMAHNNWYTLEKLIQIIDAPWNDIYLHIDSKSKDFNKNYFLSLPKNAAIHLTKRHSVTWGNESQIKAEMELFKPIVTTDFPAAYEKVTDGKNGLITHMNAESIASGVERLLVCPDLRTEFIACQKENPLSYEHEMNKFYEIIEQNIK